MLQNHSLPSDILKMLKEQQQNNKNHQRLLSKAP